MLNKFRQSRFIASLLISSILFISIQPAVSAVIVSTSDLVTQQQSQIDKEYLLTSFDREDVQMALASKGVDLKLAKLRVASMTNEEVRQLNAAEKYYQTVFSKWPDYAPALNNLAQVLFEKKQYKEAEKFILRAILLGDKRQKNMKRH